jgi:vacuolar protein sorting-associated protein 45
LANTEWPLLTSDLPYSSQASPAASNVIVFIIGGATYEEAKEMAQSFNQNGIRVVVGGNFVHNSKSFMADISQIQIQKGPQMPQFEIE